jgi:tetratricopeptide (TPR) repeat protein
MSWTIILALQLAMTSIATQMEKLHQMKKAAGDAFAMGDYRAALRIYNEVIQSNPSDTTAQFYKGLCHVNFGEYDQSFLPLFFATRSKAFRSKAQYFLAKAYESTGAMFDALSNIRGSLRADSAFAPARIKYVELLCAVGEYESARKFVDAAPTFDLLMTLGNRLVAKRRCVDGVAAAKRALAADSTSLAALLLLADAYSCADSSRQSCEIYEATQNRAWNYPIVLKKVAACYDRRGKTELALMSLKSYLIATNDASVTVLSDIGRMYYALSRFDSAKVYFIRALKEDSTQAYTYYNLGLAYYQLEKYSAAERALDMAVKLSASSVESFVGKIAHAESAVRRIASTTK